MSKSLTVKDLAAKYGVSANLIAAELVRQGVKVDKAEKTRIPEDMTDLIESFFDDLYGQQDEENCAYRADPEHCGGNAEQPLSDTERGFDGVVSGQIGADIAVDNYIGHLVLIIFDREGVSDYASVGLRGDGFTHD